MHYVKLFSIVAMIFCSWGCGNKPKELKANKTVEDLSGITTIKQGEKMKEKLKEIEKKQDDLAKDAEKTE